MPTPFAARQDRLNAAVFRHLSDTAGQLDGADVEGIFEDPSVIVGIGYVGLQDTRPTFTLPGESVDDDVEGKLLVIGARTWRVAEHRPDGAGVSVLVLEAAA